MKKILSFLVAMLIGVASFAQKKGDMFISGTISADLGSQTTSLSDGGYSASVSQPLSSSFSFGVEYGYFVADNLRLAMAMSVPFSYSPVEEVEGKWLKDKASSFAINPNVAYYVRLADRFYYTPEVGVSVNFGSLKEQLSKSETYTTPFWGWNVYANLLALELRASDKIAIGAIFGAISYSSTIYTNVDTDYKASINQFVFDLNNSSIYYRFFF